MASYMLCGKGGHCGKGVLLGYLSHSEGVSFSTSSHMRGNVTPNVKGCHSSLKALPPPTTSYLSGAIFAN